VDKNIARNQIFSAESYLLLTSPTAHSNITITTQSTEKISKITSTDGHCEFCL